jgi:acetylornithine deacetylase/succinyl-diaminopimelate desuccinylase-like protein
VAPIQRELFSRIDHLRDRMVALLAEIVRINSTTPTLPGTIAAEVIGGETRVNDVLHKRYADAGCVTHRVAINPERSNLVAIRPGHGHGRSLILNGHIDTVAPMAPDRWRSGGPWTPLIEGGRVYGLGTTDMKGGAAAMWAAMQALDDGHVELAGEVQVHSVVGEEMMEHELGTTALIQAGYRADAAIVTEATSYPRPLTVSPVTAGNWLVRISIEGKSTHCGNRPLMIHPGGDGDLIGVNALEKAIKVIGWMAELESRWGLSKRHHSFSPGFFTIGPNILRADPGVPFPAYVPDHAVVEYVIWYPPDVSAEAIAREVEAYVFHESRLDPWLADHAPAFDWYSNWPAMETDWEHPLTAAVVKARDTVLGTSTLRPSPAQPANFGAVCDASFYAAAGIPAVVFGPGDLRIAHGLDESVSIDEMITAAKTLASTVIDWCGLA